MHADLVVIGSGPAGQKAAIQAAKLGKSVIVIEKDPYLGGASLNSGTIPSKTLRAAILDLTALYQRGFGRMRMDVTIGDLYARLSKVLREERAILERQFDKNGIRFVHGLAAFRNEHQVVVGETEITGEVFVIATGSNPRNPTHVPFDDKRVLDSTRLLSIDAIPNSMIVMGGGVIGSEYASFFSALGTKVTVVDRKEQMLPLLDKEVGMHLQKALQEIGLTVIGGKEYERIDRSDGKVTVTFSDGTILSSDVLLFALGRVANVDGLAIEMAGLQIDQRGYIPVNSLFQTMRPHIYAVGDVIGGPALASTSMEQGRIAALHAFGGKVRPFPVLFPIGIYSIPEISSCGYTEEELKNLGCRYQVGRAYYYEIAKNQITGNEPGLFKILFHADTLEILGVHIIGREATEVIHIGQVAMTFHARIDYFIDHIFNYPTYAEGYRIAALNGMNKR